MYLEFADIVPIIVIHAGNLYVKILAPRRQQKAARIMHILKSNK